MIATVLSCLLNLLNELRNRDKFEACLPRILSPFSQRLYKFNNTGALMLDSINYTTLK